MPTQPNPMITLNATVTVATRRGQHISSPVGSTASSACTLTTYCPQRVPEQLSPALLGQKPYHTPARSIPTACRALQVLVHAHPASPSAKELRRHSPAGKKNTLRHFARYYVHPVYAFRPPAFVCHSTEVPKDGTQNEIILNCLLRNTSVNTDGAGAFPPVLHVPPRHHLQYLPP